MRMRVEYCVALAFLWSCGGSTPAPEAGPTQDPEAANEALFSRLGARETALPEVQEAESQDGRVSVSVPSAAPVAIQAVEDNDSYYFQAALGTDSPVECWLYPDGVDPATSVRALRDNIISIVAEPHGGILKQQIAAIDAGVVAEEPYLQLETLALAGEAASPQGLYSKLRWMNHNDSSVICSHFEFGYRETFGRWLEALLARLSIKTDGGTQPFFRDVAVLALNDMNVGFTHLWAQRNKDGTVLTTQQRSYLIPRSVDAVIVGDSFSFEMSKGKRLLSVTTIESEEGELVTQLQTTRAEGRWQIKGMFKSKPIDQEVKFSGEPRPMLTSMRRTRKALRSNGVLARKGKGVLRYFAYQASGNPLDVLESTMRRIGKTDEGRIEVAGTLGALEVSGIVNADGTMHSYLLPVGANQMKVTQVWKSGSF